MTAAPDFVWQLLDWTSRGNVVIIEWQTTRHVNGVRFEWRGATTNSASGDGRIAEERVYSDTAPLRAFRSGEQLEPITTLSSMIRKSIPSRHHDPMGRIAGFFENIYQKRRAASARLKPPRPRRLRADGAARF